MYTYAALVSEALIKLFFNHNMISFKRGGWKVDSIAADKNDLAP
jgi:hypothetical protein